MALTSQQSKQIQDSARGMDLRAAGRRVEDFIAEVQSIETGKLEELRESLLRDQLDLPSFIVSSDPLGTWTIAGLLTYLEQKAFSVKFRERLQHHADVKRALIELENTNHLEAVAA